MNVNKNHLDRFEFNEESIGYFREKGFIPVDFYNKDGQVLIHKKPQASGEDISRLLKFESQGIFYNKNDLEKIRPPREKKATSINGRPISEAKTLDPSKVLEFARQSQDLLNDLKRNVLTSGHAASVQRSIQGMLNDFTTSPEFETGLINVVEVLSGSGVSLHSELVTKRTVVAMGLKVRTRKIVQLGDEKQDKIEHLNLMSASYLADIGYTRLQIPENADLTPAQYEVVKSHPFVSYLMIANNPDINHYVKKLVLNHHRPYKGEGVNNNFPKDNELLKKLSLYKAKYAKEESKQNVVNDIATQLQLVTNQSSHPMLEEDISILSLASEFASLTTEQSWRSAYKPTSALKIILNNCFFLYNDKSIRDMLDYVGLSLSDNKPILHAGDIVVTALVDSEKKLHFDLCRILKIERFQTRPLMEKIGSIRPVFRKDFKYKIFDFDPTSIQIQKRQVVFDLMRSVDNRRIVYLVDPDMNPTLHNSVIKSLKGA